MVQLVIWLLSNSSVGLLSWILEKTLFSIMTAYLVLRWEAYTTVCNMFEPLVVFVAARSHLMTSRWLCIVITNNLFLNNYLLQKINLFNKKLSEFSIASAFIKFEGKTILRIKTTKSGSMLIVIMYSD